MRRQRCQCADNLHLQDLLLDIGPVACLKPKHFTLKTL